MSAGYSGGDGRRSSRYSKIKVEFEQCKIAVDQDGDLPFRVDGQHHGMPRLVALRLGERRHLAFEVDRFLAQGDSTFRENRLSGAE